MSEKKGSKSQVLSTMENLTSPFFAPAVPLAAARQNLLRNRDSAELNLTLVGRDSNPSDCCQPKTSSSGLKMKMLHSIALNCPQRFST